MEEVLRIYTIIHPCGDQETFLRKGGRCILSMDDDRNVEDLLDALGVKYGTSTQEYSSDKDENSEEWDKAECAFFDRREELLGSY